MRIMMKNEIISRLRGLRLSSKFDRNIEILNIFRQDSTRLALAIDNYDEERILFVEISWLEDVENDRFIFEVVETDENDDEYCYKTYHIDRLIDNLLETFAKFDIVPEFETR